MKDEEISLFYSNFLFQLSSEKKTGKHILSQLQESWNTIESHDVLCKILDSDLLSPRKKQQLIQRIFNKTVDASTLIIMEKIAIKNKIYLLPEILKKLSYQIQVNNGVLPVTLIVSQPLDDQNKLRVKEKMASYYQKQIKLEEIIDPKMIGGMILLFDHKMLDYSIKTKLSCLKKSLLKESLYARKS